MVEALDAIIILICGLGATLCFKIGTDILRGRIAMRDAEPGLAVRNNTWVSVKRRYLDWRV